MTAAQDASVEASGAAELPSLLRDLLEARGPSGHETAPATVWRAAAEPFAAVTQDGLGSTVARVAGHGDAGRLAVVGHIDEIGLIISHIDDEGFLWFRSIGGWDAQILVGQRVRIDTGDGSLIGVIGKKATHLLREEERNKVADLRDLNIDIGAPDGAQARERVRIGDVAVLDADPVMLLGSRVAARAMDNRLGSYVALEAARQVAAAGGAACEVCAIAAVQEEITFAGASTSAYSLAPTLAIVVDVTHATDAPGSDVRYAGAHPLGSGAVIGRGSILHPGMFELLHEAAEAEGIPFTVEASGRTTGTDADAVHLSRAGVPTGLVSIPLRYMHSPVEVVHLDDVQACARLIAAFAARLPSAPALTR